MNRIEIKIGDRYGRLVIVREIGGTPRKFECVCDCGNQTIKWLSNLRNNGARGPTTSCGCIRVEVTIKRNTTHGLAHVPEYEVWCGIRKRLHDVKCKSYPDYGGRGIVMADEWNDFEAFYRDLGPRPSTSHTIERNDCNGNYCKDNCRWATRKEQNRNTRANRRLTIFGETKCLAEWDETFSSKGLIKAGQFKSSYHHYGLDAAIDRVFKKEKNYVEALNK